MTEATIKAIEVIDDRSSALLYEQYTNNFFLTADTPVSYTVPNDATHVIIAGDQDIWVSWLGETDIDAMVVNGTFTGDSDWTKGTGWTLPGTVATSDASQAADSDLEQTMALTTTIVEGQAYYVTFTVTAWTAGVVTAVVGGTEGTDRGSATSFTETIIAGSSDVIALRADASFDGSVDNLVIVPAAGITTADNTTGKGSVLNPTTRYIKDLDRISIVSATTGAKGSLAFYKI